MIFSSTSTEAPVAIVTGAASGIGQAVAARLVTLGYHVAIWDIDTVRGSKSADELRAKSRSVEFFEVDVSDYACVAESVNEVLHRLGVPQALVTCAGLSIPAPLPELTSQDWYGVMRVNLDGTFFCLSEVAKVMIQASVPGSIVTISSTAALSGFSKRGAYCASKSGVVGLTRAAALDLARHGIRVNSVAPGSTRTPLTQRYADDPAIRELIASVPMRRWAEPEEIADAVGYLIGPHASFVTGVVLPVDGGWTAGRLSLSEGEI